MKRKILVLGANGFVGRHLVAALAASPWASPIAAVRRPAPVDDGVKRLVFDATDSAALAGALAGVDGVVNCVAGDPQTISAGAQALFTCAARQQPTPRIVHLSSMAVYGAASGIVGETAPLSAGSSPYAAAKIAAEEFAARCESTVTLRPGIIYGPGSSQWTARVARWLIARRIGDLGAAGDGYCNLVFIDDVLAAIAASLEMPDIAGSIFNLSLPSPPTWNEYFIAFARALAAVPVRRITRRRLKIETKLLAPPLKIAEILGAKLRLKFALPPPMPPSLLALFQQEIRLDVTRAEKTLGLTWTRLDAGLTRSADWVLRHR